MYIHRCDGWKIEHRLREKLSVRNHNKKIAWILLQCINLFVDVFWLDDRNCMCFCQSFDGWRSEDLFSSNRAIWLCDNKGDIKCRVIDQCLQARDSKVWCATKDDGKWFSHAGDSVSSFSSREHHSVFHFL